MPLIEISHLDDPRLLAFSRMTDAELRDPKQMVGLARALGDDPESLSEGLFIGESRNVIERALGAGIEPFAVLVERCWLTQTEPLIERLIEADATLPVFVATRDQMRALTGFERTRGALAAFRRPALPPPGSLLESATRVAVLENVTNHTNIGAIFRSAAALGIDAVLVTPSCHDPYYRRAARVSMGTVFQVPWTRIGSGADWACDGMPLLHEHGFTTCALALSDDSIRLQDDRLKKCDKLALVLGTEGDGLAARTIAACDYTVRIPMSHDVDSLNVAAASAVAFWELRAER